MIGHNYFHAIAQMSSTKQTIGIVTWDFLHPKGGMGRSMQWMAEALSEDFQVEVLPIPAFLQFSGGHLLFSLWLPLVLHQWIRTHHVSAILFPTGPGGIFLLNRLPVPAICVVYHLYEQQARLVPGQRWKKIFVPFEKKTLRSASHVLSFNRDTHAILQSAYAISSQKITGLSHAIADAWKGSDDQKKQKGLCVCIARLEARKGVDVLLGAWPSVIAKIPDAQLIIVGDGILASSCDAAINKIGTSVKRIDTLPFADLIELVQRAEVCVCPSYLEGFGLSAAEAQVAGTVVVASDAEGLRCLFRDGETGFLFPTGDTHALADRIIEVLHQDDRRKTIAMTAQTEAEKKFDRSQTSDSLRHAIHEAVTKHS